MVWRQQAHWDAESIVCLRQEPRRPSACRAPSPDPIFPYREERGRAPAAAATAGLQGWSKIAMAGPRIPLPWRFQASVLFSLPFHLPLACTHFTGRSAWCLPSPSSAACPETPQPGPQPTRCPACSVSPADGTLAGEPIAKGQPWCPPPAGM